MPEPKPPHEEHRSPRDPGKRTGTDQGLPLIDRDKHFDDGGRKLRDLEHVGAMAPDTDASEEPPAPPRRSP